MLLRKKERKKRIPRRGGMLSVHAPHAPLFKSCCIYMKDASVPAPKLHCATQNDMDIEAEERDTG
jgi:hypothetical protein